MEEPFAFKVLVERSYNELMKKDGIPAWSPVFLAGAVFVILQTILDKIRQICYNTLRHLGVRLPHTVGGRSLFVFDGGLFSLRSCERRGMRMNYITLSELFQLMLVLISFATFILTFCNNNKKK